MELKPEELFQAIINCDDRPIVRIEVPEWPVEIYGRAMTGKQRDAWELESYRQLQNGGLQDNVRAHLAARTLCTSDGHPLCSVSQVEQLGECSGNALDRVFQAAQRINGLTDKDVEELEGNLGAAQSGFSDSGSH